MFLPMILQALLWIGLTSSCISSSIHRPEYLSPAEKLMLTRFMAFDLDPPEPKVIPEIAIENTSYLGINAVKIAVIKRDLNFGSCRYSYCTKGQDCQSAGLLADQVVDPRWKSGSYEVKVQCCSLAGSCVESAEQTVEFKRNEADSKTRLLIEQSFEISQDYFELCEKHLQKSYDLLKEYDADPDLRKSQTIVDIARLIRNQTNLGVDFIAGLVTSNALPYYVGLGNSVETKLSLASGESEVQTIEEEKTKKIDERTTLMIGVIELGVTLSVFGISVGSEMYAEHLEHKANFDQELQDELSLLKRKRMDMLEAQILDNDTKEAAKLKDLTEARINDRIHNLTGYKTYTDFLVGTKRLHRVARVTRVLGTLSALATTAYSLSVGFQHLELSQAHSFKAKVGKLLMEFAGGLTRLGAEEATLLQKLAG